MVARHWEKGETAWHRVWSPQRPIVHLQFTVDLRLCILTKIKHCEVQKAEILLYFVKVKMPLHPRDGVTGIQLTVSR